MLDTVLDLITGAILIWLLVVIWKDAGLVVQLEAENAALKKKVVVLVEQIKATYQGEPGDIGIRCHKGIDTIPEGMVLDDTHIPPLNFDNEWQRIYIDGNTVVIKPSDEHPNIVRGEN